MDWRYLVQIINQTTVDNLITADIDSLKLSKIPLIEIPVWYDDNEKNKIKLKGLLPIEEMEDNEFLMGDITPLLSTEIQKEIILKKWSVLKQICKAFNPIVAQKSPHEIQFANWFRLYRLVSGLIELHHIDYCIWDFEGCFYSSKPNDPWWIESNQIESLMSSDNPMVFMKNYVKEKVQPFIYHPSDHKELVVSWMTIKTIQADLNGELLDYSDKRAISAFINLKDNFIVPMEEFHWGNIYCGYSYSYTVSPARDESNWNKKNNLDSPITSIDFIQNFYERSKDIINMEIIEDGDREVEQIIKSFICKEGL